MRIFTLIRSQCAYIGFLALGALLLSACGSGGGDATATAGSTRAPSADGPTIEVPSGPPPQHVVTKDLVLGKGIPIQPALPSNQPVSYFTAIYKSADYDSGEVVEDRWEPDSPGPYQLGPGGVVAGWEVGLVGMKAGGRRELVVPSRLAYGEGARVYVVEVFSVKKVD